jgi:hypothetical protein
MVLASLQAPKGQPVDVTGKAPYLGEVTAEGPAHQPGGRAHRHHDAELQTPPPAGRRSTRSPPTARAATRRCPDVSTSRTPRRSRPRRDQCAEDQPRRLRLLRRDRAQLLGRARAPRCSRPVNFSDGDFCNAFFSSGLEQMVYGNPCEGPTARCSWSPSTSPGTRSPTESPSSTSGLNYTGQSGALNESFSDYFGNVIGDSFYEHDSATLGEDGCAEVTGPQSLCSANPSGELPPVTCSTATRWTTTST